MTISMPEVNATIIPATTTQSVAPEKVLFVGQKVAAGTATAGALVTEIGNAGEENTLFGANSQIAGMIREFKKINKETRVDAISLNDNGSGVPAAGTVAFAGTASAAGTITVNIGSAYNHSYTYDAAVGATAANIGAALETLINADTYANFTAADTSGSVAITCDNDGTEGNKIGLQVYGLPAGITCTVTGMASGATNPTLTGIFDVIQNIRYQTIVFPSSYGYTFITDLLDDRFNTDNAIMDGVGICSMTDSLADLKTNEGAENSASLVIFGNKEISSTYYKGSALFELDVILASRFAAVRSLRFTDGANVSRYVIAKGGLLDARGGIHLASKPYFNTPIINTSLVQDGLDWTQTEIAELKAKGISVISNNTANSAVICGEILTTYKTDSAGNADTSWQFLNAVDTMQKSKEYIFNNFKSDYPQSRLTEGDLIGGYDIANENKIAASVEGYNSTLANDYVLTQAGEDALNNFRDNLDVSIDMATQKVTITCKLYIVRQLRGIDITMQQSF